MEPLLEIHQLITQSRRKWRMVYQAIFCSRAFSSLSLPSQNTTPFFTPLSSFNNEITLDDDEPTTITFTHLVNLGSHYKELLEQSRSKWCTAYRAISCVRAFVSIPSASSKKPVSSNIDVFFDHPSLTQLVRDKNLVQLSASGGVKGIASAIKSDVERGIEANSEDIKCRQEDFGLNTFTKPPTRKSFFHFVCEALKDPAVVVLLSCAILSLGFGIKQNGLKQGWYDGGSILVAVFLAICVTATSNFRQSRQFDKPGELSNNIQVEVVRSGRQQHVSVFDIVVGDVVSLNIGDQVPADGLFIDGHSLTVDESSITGESDYVQVDHASNPFLFSGTKVADGYARMLIVSVGMSTAWGEIMSKISRDCNKLTLLQVRLNKLTTLIVKVGLSVAFIDLVVLSIRYFTGHTKDKNGNAVVVGIIAGAASILGVAIPVGLPFAVTLTLAYSMKRMMANQAMVRELSACETMGSATVICTDKTGTLTMNKMEVTKFWVAQESMEEKSYSSISASLLELIHQGAGLNTGGNAYKPDLGSEVEFSGSPTEKAILSFAVLQLHMDLAELKQNYTLLRVEVFNSEKKRSGILMKKNSDNTVHVHWKGAAEMILEMCSNYYDLDGNAKAVDDAERKKFNQLIEGMAASSLRCIAFAHKQVLPGGKLKEEIEDNCLTLLGLVGLKDPCWPGAKKAVEDCRHARVNIKMITGDNVFTAKAIATECGILRPNADISCAVVQGMQFRNYTPKERMEKIDQICVMARSSASDKLLMVKCLKQKGHVVAVTGDGTNDASALKEADIGLSMGIQGTDVAKESSDIVILDDNFASVATVLRWGRCVYNKIQKFIQFQLTVNLAAIVINLIAAVSAGEVPLTAVQLLWVNIIMDTLGAFALATEEPSKELMEKPPVGRSEPLITNIMWRNIIAQSLYEVIVLLTLQFEGEAIFNANEKVRDTLIFNTFVLCQVLNDFNEWKPEKKNIFEEIRGNKLFWGINVVRIALQVVMIEFLKKFADTERLNWWQWGACIGLAAMSWLIGWLVKLVPVPEKPFFSFLT